MELRGKPVFEDVEGVPVEAVPVHCTCSLRSPCVGDTAPPFLPRLLLCKSGNFTPEQKEV